MVNADFDSLENSDEYPAWSLDEQINFNEETFLEGPTTNLPNNENDNVFSTVEGIFDQSDCKSLIKKCYEYIHLS